MSTIESFMIVAKFQCDNMEQMALLWEFSAEIFKDEWWLLGDCKGLELEETDIMI